MKLLPLILGGVLIGLVAANAQSPSPALVLEKPPLPGGPLLVKMEAFSSWKITYSYATDAIKKSGPGATPAYPDDPTDSLLPAAIRSTTVTRTRPLWHATSIDVKGHILDQGGNGADHLILVANSAGPTFAPTEPSGGLANGLVDYQKVDFPDMEFISAKTYIGVQKLEDNICIVFKGPTTPAGEPTAWIDLATRFPVRWQRGTESRTFERLDPPTAPLVLPPQMDKLFESVKQERARLARPIPRGG